MGYYDSNGNWHSSVDPPKKNNDGSVGNNDRATSINNTDEIEYRSGNAIYEYTDDWFDNYTLTQRENNYTQNFRVSSLSGIEGIPYQFLPSVDRRIDPASISGDKKNSNELSLLGRKYTEKIVTQIPLLFMAPCNPRFMGDKRFSDTDRGIVESVLLGAASDVLDLLEGSGRFYSASFAFPQYHNYLNAMLLMVATYLGIENESVRVGEEVVKIKDANWANETHTPLGSAANAANNLIFYIDSIDTISESFSNSTKESSIASMINGFSDQAKELDYLFGSSGSNLISSMASSAKSAVGGIMDSLGTAAAGLGGDIVGSLSKGGIQSILDGGKIVFPEMWADSQYSRSYSIDLKLRSPDNDSLSIFLNVLKPYCKLLCFTLPHMVEDNVNTYRTPFITRAYCKGLFNVDLGMITAMSVNKGATCCWNDDGLPTQIDISLELTDLYSSLTMTGYVKDSLADGGILSGPIKQIANSFQQTYNIVNNTAYMDFLANMAGLNINEMEFGRKAKMYYDLFTNQAGNLWEERFGANFTNITQNFLSRVYQRF